jgi:hypothetical protein
MRGSDGGRPLRRKEIERLCLFMDMNMVFVLVSRGLGIEAGRKSRLIGMGLRSFGRRVCGITLPAG